MWRLSRVGCRSPGRGCDGHDDARYANSKSAYILSQPAELFYLHAGDTSGTCIALLTSHLVLTLSEMMVAKATYAVA